MSRVNENTPTLGARCDGSQRVVGHLTYRQRCDVCGRSYKVRKDGRLPVHHLPAASAALYNRLAKRRGW